MVQGNDRGRLLSQWAPALILMGVIFIFSSIPGDDFSPWPANLDLIVSKGGHMLGYGLLAAAYLRGIGYHTVRGYSLAWGLAVLYGLTDEIHQSFVPGRMNSIWDVGINAAGALIGLLVWRAHKRR